MNMPAYTGLEESVSNVAPARGHANAARGHGANQLDDPTSGPGTGLRGPPLGEFQDPPKGGHGIGGTPQRHQRLAALEPGLVQEIGRRGVIDHRGKVFERSFMIPRVTGAATQLEGAGADWEARVVRAVAVRHTQQVRAEVAGGFLAVALPLMDARDLEQEPRFSGFGDIRQGALEVFEGTLGITAACII